MRIGITGISGSFGSALCAMFAANPDHTIVGITRDELKAEQIMARHRAPHDNVRVMVIAAGLADEPAMNRVFRQCDWLIHAAALKRISGSVYATEELVKTNVLGTMNVLEVARKQGIAKTLVISSDKACEATNLYGSTKFTAECLAVQSNAFIFPATGGTVSCVRWGNVLGSRGSVVHHWRRQCAAGEPLSLTDSAMTRFLITMSQAVSFTGWVCMHMAGGEIFVPVLPAARMHNLALAVMLEQHQERGNIITTGLRPGGEKLHERLLTQEEPCRTVWLSGPGVAHDALMILPSHRSWSSQPYEQARDGAPLLATATDALYRSECAPELGVGELELLLRDVPIGE